jgi:hypothetical protein
MRERGEEVNMRIQTDRSHQMPVNDVNHAWTVVVDGVETYFGQCTCGKVFSGAYSVDVSRAYIEHVDEAAGRRRV